MTCHVKLLEVCLYYQNPTNSMLHCHVLKIIISLWAATLWADWQVPWDEVLCEPQHLGQTDRSLGTRFFVSRDTWGRLTGPLGRGSSWAATLGADWRVPWDEVLRANQITGTKSDFKMGVIKPKTSNEYNYAFLLNGTYGYV